MRCLAIRMRIITTSFHKFIVAIFLILFAAPAFSQVPITTDSRIRTLVYNANEVYEVKFFYNYQSFIEFSPDEEIEMISIGEAFAWRLTPAGKRLFIRPLEVSARTNMTIITNRRTYHFDIRSGEYDGKADEELVYTVRFFYPQVDQPLPILPQLAVPNVAAKKPSTPIPTALPPADNYANNSNGASNMQKPGIVKTPMISPKTSEKLPGIIQRNPEGAELNFDYSLAGKSDNIAPIKVYDDGDKVLWKAFQQWKELLDGHQTHKLTTNDFGYKTLQTNFFIQQLRANGQIYREIKLFRCWPSEVGGINFDMGSSEFVTFDVTLTFDHLDIITGI